MTRGRGYHKLGHMFENIASEISSAEEYELAPIDNLGFDQFTVGLSDEQLEKLALKHA
jgi:hypothetical protein